MQIKDDSGNIIATINLKKGVSIEDVVSNISNKKQFKTSFNRLNSIVESEDKKSIVFKFSDGDLFYDLPSKAFVRKNGVKIGENFFSSIRLEIKNKTTRCGPRADKNNNDFWVLLGSKTEVSWIKTFFKFIDIWANTKYSNTIWDNAREINRKNKLYQLNNNKEFFDSVEKFAKIKQIQSLGDLELSIFYSNILDIQEKIKRKRHADHMPPAQIVINLEKTGIDNWFIERINNNLSDNYAWPACNNYQFNEIKTRTLVENALDYSVCSKHNIKNLFQYVYDTYGGIIAGKHIDTIKKLINFGYDPKRLMDYLYSDIYNQGLDLDLSSYPYTSCALQLFYDYVNMNVEMNIDYEKYPRYLQTFHDITQKNYKIRESSIIKLKFEKVIDKLKDDKIEYSDDEYSIIIPKDSNDMILEGQNLSHCVASYYKRMANGESVVVFLRKKNNIGQSLVTIEIKNRKIVQSRAKYNSNPQKPEMDFIRKYSKYLMGQSKWRKK